MAHPLPPDTNPRDAVILLFQELVKRAEAAKLEATYVPYEDILELDDDPGYVELYLPAGHSTRRILVNSGRVKQLLKFDLSSIRALGEYTGVIDSTTGVIEVSLSSGDPRTGPISRIPLWDLPGAEILDEESEVNVEPDDEGEIVVPRRPTEWRLRVEDGPRSVEISPTSELAAGLYGSRNFTLKIAGYEVDRHDRALSVLTRVGNAFLFDLDVRYGIALQLLKRRNRLRPQRQKPVEHAPDFPRNEYSQEALALYQYGRSASGLPLLQFLAYYQSLEYFFPVFAREETVSSLRAALLNPRFNPTHDVDVNRLINLAAPAVKAGVGEREQLRATVRASVAASDLRSFIEASNIYEEHFCASKQTITGAGAIKLKGDQMDLRDQIAERIYKIRCRVVHTKQDGSGQGEELLLPSSPEVDALGPDIDMLRLIAQQALVARAKRA
ncbi:hypothetical protein NicSoilB4_07880 [Arthrobacter sp. NicSoilB4]|uniref:hypothetical protein n=1 Tax=Arthrobacter sp. NicSoilB4 TaxID=2830997 RepID=UPI001CC636E0|nr:hypothetical protein [Arthrobacter sp. NicSoilB4]BCW66025.1 hypothetical protein NicSoilB4_07880 [Arthrobacter sp. NicSoilB4]